MKKLYTFLYNALSVKQITQLAAITTVFMTTVMLPCKLLAQAPTISYSSPDTLLLNTAATLTPLASNVAAPTGAYGSPIVLGSGITFSQNGLALDQAGNMYVNEIDGSTGVIKKITADGNSTTIIDTGFIGQSANVAVDQNGNVFVADQASVWKIPASGLPVTYGTPVVINNTFSRPFGIAVDMTGNVYVSDLSTGGVYKMANDGSGKVRIDNGLSQVSALTVDAAGNVYAVDISAFALHEIPANGGAQVQLASGFSFPRGLAIDATGTVYVDDEGLGGIYSVPAGGGTPVAVIPGLTNLVGVAIDARYNLYGALQGSTGINKFSPTGGFFISPALPAGLTFNSTTGTINGTPTVESPATNYLVSAYNITDSASVTVNIKVVSKNAGLSHLAISRGQLSPVFTMGVTTYTISVVNGVSSLTLTPTTSDPNATVVINSTAVASGSASAPIQLVIGANTINVTVTANDGTTTKTYVVTITRAGSTNDNLASLNISRGTLSPGFATGTANYTDNVANGVSSITVTPASAEPNATIIVNNKDTVSTGAASDPIVLAIGANTINVKVTAQDGSTIKTYTITVTRAPSPNDNLTSLKISKGALSPNFNPGTIAYTVNVVNGASSITVTPSTAEPNATILVNGTDAVASGNASDPIAVAVGTNTIKVAVTAQDGSTKKTYAITVTRAPSPNDNLASLKINKGALSPGFNPGTVGYTANVVNGVSSITVTPATAESNATILVNGTDAVISGNASDPITLSVGTNTIKVKVTAQDGSTAKTYTITLTRAGSPNDNLASLKISRGALSPGFTPGTLSYTVNVQNGVSSMTVTPAVADANAAIVVNGADTVVSGTASDPIALAVGTNTIKIKVTAQDGVTAKTYTLTVTRAAGNADAFEPVGVEKPGNDIALNRDGVIVHQGVSPNGDGMNDYLVIDNIAQYPDNKLAIMNRNGQLVYEAVSYNNSSKAFDGHSNKNGQMQLPGTYFYSLDYTVNGITKHKTGFIVLKY